MARIPIACTKLLYERSSSSQMEFVHLHYHTKLHNTPNEILNEKNTIKSIILKYII